MAEKIIVILIILFALTGEFSSKEIQVEYEIFSGYLGLNFTSENNEVIRLAVGTEHSTILINNSTSSHLSNRSYVSVNPVSIPYKGNTINGTLSKLNLSLQEFTTKNFINFTHLEAVLLHNGDKDIYPMRSYITFGFKMDYKNSLTHILKNQGLISHEAFGLVPSNQKRYGSFYFGGIPESIRSHYFKASIPINSQNEFWSFNLSKVILVNSTNQTETFVNKYNAYFSTTTTMLRIPGEIYDYLMKNYFGVVIPELDDDLCITNILNIIECYENVLDLPPLKLIIDEKVFVIDLKNYCLNIAWKCFFDIQKNLRGDEWIFGTNFLLKYAVNFNYEEGSVEFFTEQPLEIFETHAGQGRGTFEKFVFILLSFLMIGSGVMIACSYFTKRENYLTFI